MPVGPKPPVDEDAQPVPRAVSPSPSVKAAERPPRTAPKAMLPRAYFWTAWALIALAVILRLRLYFFDRDLFLDEAMLATNLFQRPYSGLFKVLDYNQGAPIGFLLLSKALVLWLGETERVLRLLPLASGIASIFLFYALARRILPPRSIGTLCALALFAVGAQLVDFSSQFKQYSTDVAFALLLVWLALRLADRPLGLRTALPLALGGAAAVWLSHAAVIVAAATGSVLGWAAVAERQWPRVATLAAVGTTWAASMAALYFFSLRHLVENSFLLRFWKDGFMPLPPRNLGDVRWFLEVPVEVLQNPSGITFAGLGLLAGLCGGIALYRAHRLHFWLLVSPVVVTLALSALHQYPFRGRLILFLVPLFLLFVGVGIDWVRQSSRPSLRPVAVLLPLLLLAHPIAYAANGLFEPPDFARIQPAIAYLAQHKQPDDPVYVHFRAEPALEIYGPRYGLPPRYITGTKTMKDWRVLATDVRQFAGRPRVWFLLSYATEDELHNRRFLLAYLDSIGKRIEAHETYLAGAYLYDLSPP